MEDKKVKCHNLKIDSMLKCTPEMIVLCEQEDGVRCNGHGKGKKEGEPIEPPGCAKQLSSFLSYCLKIRRELESRGGGQTKRGMRPFRGRRGEYDTSL
ncbi:hypothetical protein LCGC14_1774550 [marine sediment metagenome]|uniref:Uncharacterized protein n=1 Tax=marine sediment metagenome TaxID=412755 RepID=A0A0F9JC63_9ZZZZ